MGGGETVKNGPNNLWFLPLQRQRRFFFVLNRKKYATVTFTRDST